jgi:hypothetical protein
MHRSLCLALILVVHAQLLRSDPLQDRVGTSVQGASNDLSTNAISQNSPCVDQPKSLKELTASFRKGRLPLPTEVSGSWVAIGFMGNGTDYPSLNCTGVRRGEKFEFAMVANQFSIELDAIGMSHAQTVKAKPDRGGRIEFPVDFDGDNLPVYRCRVTQRGPWRVSSPCTVKA